MKKVFLFVLQLSYVYCAIAQQPELIVPVPHTSFVNTTSFSSDGKLIATASQDNTAKIWDAFTGELLFTAHHKASVEDVIFSRNNKLLLTVSKDSTACIWDLSTRSLLHTLAGHSAEVVSGAFGAGDSIIITGARENIAILWRVKDGSIIKKIRVFEYDEFIEGSGAVFKVSFNKSGTRFLTGDFSGKCKLWDSRTKDSIRSFTSLGSYIKVARFSEDEKYIVAIEWSGFDAYIWEVATGKLINRFHSDDYFQEYASLSSDNKMLLTAYTEKSAALYNVATGKIIRLFVHADKIKDGLITKNGKYVVTASWDGIVKIWETNTGKLLQELGKGEKQTVLKINLSPNQRYCATAAQDHSVRVWDIQNGVLFRDLNFTGYSNKNGSYFIQNNKIVVSCDAYQTIFNITNLRAENEILAWDLDWSIKNQGRYIIRQSNINSKQPLTVYTREMEPVLTIDNYKYPHQQSYTGRFLFSNTLGNSGYLYSLPEGKALYRLTDNLKLAIISTAFSADDSLVAVGTIDGSIFVWATATGRQVFHADVPKGVTNICIAKNKKELLISTSNQLYWWSLETGEVIRHKTVANERLEDVQLSNDDVFIITSSADKKARVFTFADGDIIDSLDHKSFENGISSIRIRDIIDNTVVSSISNTDLLWEMKGGILNDNGVHARGGKMLVSKDKQLAVFCTPQIVVWNLAKQTVQTVIDYGWNIYEYIYDAQLSPDGKKLVLFSYSRIMMFDTYSGKLITDFPDIKTRVVSCWFDTTGQKLLLATNGFDYVYDVASLKWQYAFLTRKDKNYLIITPDGYYSSSAVVAKQLNYITNGLNTINVEQLDVKYNRPDKVLEAIGNTDTALIKSYRKAWEKRIKKLGIDTTQFRDGYSVPEADFVNRDSIEYEQKTGTLRLHIRGMDSTYKLDRFNVWVNESPLYGQRGISIKKKNSNSIDTTITIQLSQGENRIETSITNVNGTESYRMPLYVNYTPSVKQKEMIRFIGIGIDQFKESNYNLQYSSKDIRDLAVKLKERYKDSIIIDTLFNQDVKAEKVRALKEKLQQTSVNDKVIVSYSGHGLLSKDYDYYLSTYSVNFSKPEENGLPYDELENLLDSIPARKKLMFIDACHSGEVDKEEGIAMNKMADSLGLVAKGIIIDQPQQQHVGLKNSFELMQSLFVNVGKSTGATIISAAAGNQFALERGDLKNGVFTYSILEAMNKYPTMKISELKRTVGERVEQLTNGLQKPTSRNEAIAVDWSLW